jgi:outer membrane protein assembly factor BamA
MSKGKKPPVEFNIGLMVNKEGRPALDGRFSVPRLLNTSAALSVEASISSLVAHAFNVRYSLPLDSNWHFTAEAVRQVNDFVFSSSFTETVSGVRFAWARGPHTIGLDAHLRDIHPVISQVGGSKFTASEQIRRVPLRSVKTAANYQFITDSVVRTPHPVSGSKLSVLADFSGLFGDVRMTKVDSSYTRYTPLPFIGAVWASRIAAGAIAGRHQTPIQDRFFLGGTIDEKSCLRGFAVRSVGPAGRRLGSANAGFDHLGGDAYVAADNSVTFPLYSKDGIDIRGTVFGQIGSLVPTLHSRALTELGRGVRASVGAGIVVPVGAAGTMELTIGKPVFGATATDTQQMLQIGIRVSNMH